VRALVVALHVVALVSACVTTGVSTTNDRITLTLDEAEAIVHAFEATPPGVASVPAPSSADEALAVLKADRLDAFEAVVAFAQQQGARADRPADVVLNDTALLAQAQLAWGEAELMAAELVARELRTMSSADPRLLELRREDEALRLMAAEHVDAGARSAEQVLQLAPDSYLGYRIAADAARLTTNWAACAALLQQVEQVRPDSNGLRFLRGLQAWGERADDVTAARYLNEALAHDEDFVRAQAWLVVILHGDEQAKALAALAKRAPYHHVVHRFSTPSSPG
jgi:hypothetical protein